MRTNIWIEDTPSGCWEKMFYHIAGGALRVQRLTDLIPPGSVVHYPGRAHQYQLVSRILFYGFCSGIFISVMPAAVGQITPADKLGARLGAFGSVTAIAFLIGTPIAGALIQGDTVAGYQPLIIFSVS